MDRIKHTYANERISRFTIPRHITGKKYYLYVHLRDDNDDPFYFGIGTIDRGGYYYRATCGNKRNGLWKRIANKTTYKVMIIDESEIKQEMCDREIQYIQLMGKKKDKKGPLANITDGGEGLKGHKVEWTLEMRKAASDRLKSRVMKESTRAKHRANIYKSGFLFRTGENNPQSIPILQVSLTGEIIKEHANSIEAAKEFNITGSSINSAVRKGFTSAGYKWKYKDQQLQEKVDEKLRNKPVKERIRRANKSYKGVLQLSIDTNQAINEFLSLREAGRYLSIHHQKIANAYDKGTELFNYKWEYKHG